MVSPTKLNLRLLSLVCHIAEENDADEIFLKKDNVKIWPTDKKFYSIKDGKIPLGIKLEHLDQNSMLSFELWDHDTFSPNDLIGTFNLLVDERGGPFTTDLKKKDSAFARYSIEWEAY